MENKKVKNSNKEILCRNSSNGQFINKNKKEFPELSKIIIDTRRVANKNSSTKILNNLRYDK